jgi:hypothetical protein
MGRGCTGLKPAQPEQNDACTPAYVLTKAYCTSDVSLPRDDNANMQSYLIDMNVSAYGTAVAVAVMWGNGPRRQLVNGWAVLSSHPLASHLGCGEPRLDSMGAVHRGVATVGRASIYRCLLRIYGWLRPS